MNKKIRLILVILVCLIAAFYAIWQMTWTTSQGIGVSPDSTVYLVTAGNLAAGHGFTFSGKPMTHYPPGYPLALVLGRLFFPSLAVAALWMNTLLYAVNGFLFAFMAYESTRKNLLAMLAATLLFYSSRAILTLHAWAWSEPLFLLLTFITIFLFARYIYTNKGRYLVLSSFTLGLTIAVRYLGVALLPPMLIFLLVRKDYTWKTRVYTILTATSLSLLPVLTWFIRNILLTSNAANRVLNYHPLSTGKYHNAIETLYSFLSPDNAPWLVHSTMILIFAALMIALFFSLREQHVLRIPSGGFGEALARIGVLYIISYIMLLVASVTFFDASTPLDERLLSPLFLITCLTTFAAVRLYASDKGKQLAWAVCLLAAFISSGLNVNPLLKAAAENHANGMGFNSLPWKDSPVLTELAAIEPDLVVFSNGSDAILYKTGRETRFLPEKYESTSMIKNVNYKNELQAMCKEVQEGNAFLVYLDNIAWRRYFPKEDEILEKCQLPLFVDTADGTIYGTKGN